MSDKIYDILPDAKARAFISNEKYLEMYDRSVNSPEDFWAEQAEQFVTWFKKWDKVENSDYNTAQIRWFEGAELNVSYNCLDRHLETRGDQIAIIWEGDSPTDDKKITYRQLHEEVCKFANVLKAQGVKKGDRVCIYLPMIPEAAVSMLACARIGAIHSIVFGGFSPEALKDRILDSGTEVVITANESLRGSRPVPLKTNVDKAAAQCPTVRTVIVVKRTENATQMKAGQDVWYHEEMAKVSADCPPEHVNAEDPLFILYTSGSTGKPKGALHTSGGYLLYAAITHKYVFDYHDGDIYWCTADVGWVTGHSYIV